MSDGFVLNVRTNFPSVIAKLDQVSDEIGSKAMVRAMNTTITQGKTEMARDISKEFRINVSAAKKRLDVTRASSKGGEYRFQASLQATEQGRGRSMNVKAFVFSAPSRKKLKKLGLSQVYFQIKRTGGMKFVRGAFIGNKGRTLFVRTGSKRLPIAPVNTIDIPQMFNAKRINEAVRSVMLSRFEKNFDRELRVVLGGFLK
jgi:hypothetical protein